MIHPRVPIAIIGGGEGAGKAIAAVQDLTSVLITAVVCEPQELQDQIPRSLRVERVSEMLQRDDIEGVYIATPVGTHVALASQTLDAGKHVLVEKPLGLSVQDAEGLGPHLRAGLRMGVAFKKRFNGAVARARDVLHSPAQVEYVWQMPAPHSKWRYQPEAAGGGVVMDLGSHAFDLLEFLFGRIVEIRATIAPVNRGAVETEARIGVQFSADATGSIHLCWGASNRVNRLRIQDGAHRIEIERLGAGDDVFRFDGLETRFDPRTEYRRLFDAFSSDVSVGPSTIPTFADGTRNLRLIAATYESAQESRPVQTGAEQTN